MSSSAITYSTSLPHLYEDGSLGIKICEPVSAWLKEVGHVTLYEQPNATLQFVIRLTNAWEEWEAYVFWLAPYVRKLLHCSKYREKRICLYLSRETDAQLKDLQAKLDKCFSAKMHLEVSFSKEATVASLLAGTHYEFLQGKKLIPASLNKLLKTHTHISVFGEDSY